MLLFLEITFTLSVGIRNILQPLPIFSNDVNNPDKEKMATVDFQC